MKILLACPPVEAAQQQALGIRAYTPGPSHQQTQCERCQAAVWIGPKSRQQRQRHSCEVVCFKCAIASGGTLASLGGQGGDYLVDRQPVTKR